MNQQPIREWNNVQYPKEEGAAIIKELNDRTVSDKEGYNSIAEIGEKLETLENRAEPTVIENEYLVIAELLAGQADQTPGSLQYVEDATADPTVNEGYAYYEKLEASTGALADYRKLSEAEESDILAGFQKVQDQYGNGFGAVMKVIYGHGFTVIQQPDGSYRLELYAVTATGINIALSSMVPALYNYAEPLPALAYIINANPILNGKAKILISVSEEPTFTFGGEACKKLSNSFEFPDAGLEAPALFEVFLEYNGIDVTYFILEY